MPVSRPAARLPSWRSLRSRSCYSALERDAAIHLYCARHPNPVISRSWIPPSSPHCFMLLVWTWDPWCRHWRARIWSTHWFAQPSGSIRKLTSEGLSLPSWRSAIFSRSVRQQCQSLSRSSKARLERSLAQASRRCDGTSALSQGGGRPPCSSASDIPQPDSKRPGLHAP